MAKHNNRNAGCIERKTWHKNVNAERVEPEAESENEASEGVNRIAQRVNRTTEHVNESPERVYRFAESVNRLSERPYRLSEHANRKAKRVYRCAKRLNKLSESVNRMAERSYRKAERVNRLSKSVFRCARTAHLRVRMEFGLLVKTFGSPGIARLALFGSDPSAIICDICGSIRPPALNGPHCTMDLATSASLNSQPFLETPIENPKSKIESALNPFHVQILPSHRTSRDHRHSTGSY
jgi:hypothetical protein